MDLVVRACPDLIPVVEEYFAAGGEGAAHWRDRYVDRVDGLRVIGTDDSEWLSGAAAFAVFADPSAHADSRPTFVLEDLEAYEHGDVGWVACRPLLTLPDGTTLTWGAGNNGTRSSGKRDQTIVDQGLCSCCWSTTLIRARVYAVWSPVL